MINHIEICYMLDFRKLSEIPASCQRIYFGHETCEKLLPSFNEIQNLLEIAEKRQIELTFVTPFLSERGLEKVVLFLEHLKTVIPQIIEIVTPDWGLIHWIATNKMGIPVVSRFMVGQQLDFRLVENIKLPEMINHLSSCTLMKDKTMEMFHRLGVNRFELSNVFQPIVLTDEKKYHYSLHVPFVPLTIFRSCPENMDFNCLRKNCNAYNCNHNKQKWLSNHLQHDIYCLDNALYYSNPSIEYQLKMNKQIDRIVYRIF